MRSWVEPQSLFAIIPAKEVVLQGSRVRHMTRWRGGAPQASLHSLPPLGRIHHNVSIGQAAHNVFASCSTHYELKEVR
jgi:hypothetical protein